jgi:hypothetical protein
MLIPFVVFVACAPSVERACEAASEAQSACFASDHPAMAGDPGFAVEDGLCARLYGESHNAALAAYFECQADYFSAIDCTDYDAYAQIDWTGSACGGL